MLRIELEIPIGIHCDIELITVLKAILMGRQTRFEITVFVCVCMDVKNRIRDTYWDTL